MKYHRALIGAALLSTMSAAWANQEVHAEKVPSAITHDVFVQTPNYLMHAYGCSGVSMDTWVTPIDHHQGTAQVSGCILFDLIPQSGSSPGAGIPEVTVSFSQGFSFAQCMLTGMSLNISVQAHFYCEELSR